jgi:chromosome partitioning protein
MVKKKERDALIEISQSFASIIIPHAIKNRIAYEEAQQDAIGVFDLKTRSGNEAAKEFKGFVEWLLDKASPNCENLRDGDQGMEGTA